jgi:hypothetical protein
MNLAKVLIAANQLGARATEIDLVLESHSHEMSETKIKSWTETKNAMFAGERAIRALLKERDNLCAFIYNEQRNVEYNRQLLKSIIEEKTLL